MNLSYDEAFETRVSADIEYRFGSLGKTTDKRKVSETPAIKAMLRSPSNRNVRIHDANSTADSEQLAIKCFTDAFDQSEVLLPGNQGTKFGDELLKSSILKKVIISPAVSRNDSVTVGSYIASLNWDDNRTLGDFYNQLKENFLNVLLPGTEDVGNVDLNTKVFEK